MDDETIGEVGSDKPVFEQNKRREMGMNDLDDASRYLDLAMGTTVELITKKVEHVPDEKYCLSNSRDSDGLSYKIEITDQDGQVLSVTSWALWNKIRAAFKAIGEMVPVQLKIKHEGHGTYEVSYYKDDKWLMIE